MAEGGKMLHQSVVSLFESQWSTLQMVVLREILLSAVRAGDPLAAWGAAARLLRSYYPLITPAGQNGLAIALSNSADRLPSGTRCADPALPFIRSSPVPKHFPVSKLTFYILCSLITKIIYLCCRYFSL